MTSCAGPCISTDTACSSSLVATHLAHKGLLLEECNAAVAAGSNVMLLAGTTAAICQLQVTSHTVGMCLLATLQGLLPAAGQFLSGCGA